MAKDMWLPKGYELPDGSRIRKLLYFADEWQILDTNGSNSILLANSELIRKWEELCFLEESLFREVTVGDESLCYLSCHQKYALAPVENGISPESKVDALSFAYTLKESRSLSGEVSFHDAIYVEQYSRLLPTWTLTPHVDDQVLLATWITGGVVISTQSFRRLTQLSGWLNSTELAEIIEAAGLSVPTGAEMLAKRKTISRQNAEAQTCIAAESEKSEDLTPSEGVAESKVFKLPGRPQLEAFFNEHIIDIILNGEKYKALGIDFPSAIILHGPPGCGKTFAVDKLVEFIDWPCYSIDSNSIGSPYIHETSKKISEVFDSAIDNAPSVIVIDEMESFLTDRSAGSSSGLHHVEEVAEFLRRIPEAIKSKVLIIAMTNMIDMIDPAIMRRGRFDHILEVSMPSRVEVSSLLTSLLEKLPVSNKLNLEDLLDRLTGRALSDSAFVIREAARLAAKVGKSQLDQESIDQALEVLPKEENKSRRIGFVWDDE